MTRAEAIKILMGYCHTSQERAALEVLIPELAESEDERIRKAIIGIIKNSNAIDINVSHKRMLAYLEKQKDIEDRWVEDRGQCFWDGVEEGKMLAENQKEQKPAEWSEEDEEILKLLILNIGRYKDFGGMSSERILAFLKSLRPQYHGDVTMTEAYKMGKEAGEASHWKPSEEQMNALYDILHPADTVNRHALESLYEQLKHL